MNLFKPRSPGYVCVECARDNVPHANGKLLFHYARCGRVCGGFHPKKGFTREDAPEGVHYRATCVACLREARG